MSSSSRLRSLWVCLLALSLTASWLVLPGFPGQTAPRAAAATITFADVTPETPFYTEILWLAAQGISTGYVEPDGTRTYRRLNPVARDAMAAFMYRLKGSPVFTPPAQSPFTDVPTSHPFYREITWLADQGISTGYPAPDGTKTYRPADSVARDAMAAFLYRLRGKPAFTPPATSPFTDVPTTYSFFKEIVWLAGEGITTGYLEVNGTRTYRPAAPVYRDAMAAFMYRFANPGTIAPLGVSTTAVADGLVGASYSVTLVAQGGLRAHPKAGWVLKPPVSSRHLAM